MVDQFLKLWKSILLSILFFTHKIIYRLYSQTSSSKSNRRCSTTQRRPAQDTKCTPERWRPSNKRRAMTTELGFDCRSEERSKRLPQFPESIAPCRTSTNKRNNSSRKKKSNGICSDKCRYLPFQQSSEVREWSSSSQCSELVHCWSQWSSW